LQQPYIPRPPKNAEVNTVAKANREALKAIRLKRMKRQAKWLILICLFIFISHYNFCIYILS